MHLDFTPPGGESGVFFFFFECMILKNGTFQEAQKTIYLPSGYDYSLNHKSLPVDAMFIDSLGEKNNLIW